MLLGLLLAPFASSVHARTLAVIVNPRSHVESLSRYQVIDIFMGRYRKLPSGVAALPVDLARGSAERDDFYHLLIGKNSAEIGAYWARLIFSGQASPPFQTESSQSALELVANNPNAIAYIDLAAVDHRVKVVFEIQSR